MRPKKTYFQKNIHFQEDLLFILYIPFQQNTNDFFVKKVRFDHVSNSSNILLLF